MTNKEALRENEATGNFKSWYMLVIGYFYFGQGYSLASMVLLLPLYMKDELEIGSYSRSIVISAIIIFPWYFKVVFGIITDNYPIGKYGRRKPYLIISTLFSIIGWLTLGIHNSVNALFILSGISLATGSAFADSVVDGQTVELTPKNYISRIQGIAWGSRGLGIGLTGVASALIVDNYGWQVMFYVSSVFGISISIIALLLPQTKVTQNQPGEDKQIVMSLKKILMNDKSTKQLSYFFFSGLSLLIVPLLSIIMRDEFDYSLTQIGYGAITFAFGSFIGAMVNGILFDKKESRTRIISLFVSFAVAISLGLIFPLTSLSHNLKLDLILINRQIEFDAYQFAYFGIIGILSGSFEGYQLKIIQESSPKRYESTGFAIFTGISNIGQLALGGVLVIYLSEILNLSLFIPLQLTILFIAISIFPLLKLKNL
ncbi:MAG: Folate-biopterin transporter [Candidatus Heimdallarchaeota archaeon LC_2]|nr:MAG: Folate-biopterin transporter [Candidatus Heimdallarchaeota archaeon LC_2]